VIPVLRARCLGGEAYIDYAEWESRLRRKPLNVRILGAEIKKQKSQ